MTRDEQILKAGEETASNPFELEGFIEGAEWADDHPDLYSVTRKAVEMEKKHLIDKVCEWLTKNMEDYTIFYENYAKHFAVTSEHDYKIDFIDAFRKAMEEQQ